MRMTLFLVFGCLLFCISSPAQAQSLTLNGVGLSLGEPEAKARADIAESGMEINKMGTDSFTISVKRDDTFHLLGEVAFKNGKITWIQRDWFLTETPSDKNTLANIVYSATASLLEGRQTETCTVSVSSQDNSQPSHLRVE